MKKLLAFFLSAALAVTSFFTAFAAEPKIVCAASGTDVKMGDTFTVTISLSDYEPIKAAGILFAFEGSMLEVVSGEWLVADPLIKDFNPNFLTAAFAYSSAQDINGDIFRLTLRVKADAPSAGDTAITIAPQLRNEAGQNIEAQSAINISVTITCNEHKYGDLIPAVPAKCGVEGKKAYYACSVCHKLFDENEKEVTEADLVIPALHHIAGSDWQSDADNHWKNCANGCGTIMDKTAHAFEWVVDTSATEDAPGLQHEECTVCGYKRNENAEIPQLPHMHIGITHHEMVAATCHSTGTVEYWTCSSDKCAGKYYGNAECTTELASITTPVNPANHDGGTEVRDAAGATCGTDGYTGDTYCLGCETKLSAGITIPATGEHTDEDGEWKSDGTDHWHTCSVCGTPFDKAAHTGGKATCSAKAVCSVCDAEYGEINPDNHVHTENRDAVAATEESDGYTGDTWCMDCGKKIAEGTVIPKLDHTHDMLKTEAKPATHEEDGNIEYYTCTKCGKLYRDAEGVQEITLADTVIPAAGHTYGEEYQFDQNGHWRACSCGERTDAQVHIFGGWTVTQEATETVDGCRERVCSACGYTQTEVIPATGPSRPPASQGDVDGNGVVNISDVMAACRILARAAGETPPTSAEILAADVNGSGTVDILDIMGICRILAGKKA